LRYGCKELEKRMVALYKGMQFVGATMDNSLPIQSTESLVSKPLSRRVALVTGGTRGIGFEIARSLATAGADLAICGINADRLKKTEEYFAEMGVEILALPCDVRDEEQVKRLVSNTIKGRGSIDILVNNAGIYRTQTVRGHSLPVWNEVMETNLTGAMLASREVIDGMIARNWGRIVNISSVSGKAGELAGSAYSASKFGMIGLTRWKWLAMR
jgi:NAD(P)-dependent dehydrogenase (short-subunit alcohol dehydrogenase family)